MIDLKLLDRLGELRDDINYDSDIESSVAEFKKLIKDIDLNETITVLYVENYGYNFFNGDLTENWFELLKGNWSDGRYWGRFTTNPDYDTTNLIASMTVCEFLTYEGGDDIDEAIDEVQPDFKPEIKESMTLRPCDLLNRNGFLKVKMLDHRYMLTDDEDFKILSYFESVEEEDSPEDVEPFIFNTTDILTGEAAYFKIEAKEADSFINNGGIDFCEYEQVSKDD